MKDPICGMEVAEPPKIRSEREGRVYGFCSEGCKKKFDSNAAPASASAQPSLKGYLILSAVLDLIIAFTVLRRFFAHDWSLHEIMTDFMGAFFAVFGAFKLLDLRAFADAYASYDLLAAQNRLYGYLYPFLQLALGAAYLTRFNPAWTNGAAVTLMAFSSLGVARALASKRKIRCACLGTKIQLPMTLISLVEDALMAAMAGAMLLLRA